MLVVLAERIDVLAQGAEVGLRLASKPNRAAILHIWHDAPDPEQAVADLRGEIAAAADPPEDDAKIGGGARRAAIAAGFDRAGPEKPMRHIVELCGDAFENIGDAIDDRIHQASKRLMWGRVHSLGGGRERGRRLKTHRDEVLRRQNKADRRRLRIVGSGAVHQRRA